MTRIRQNGGVESDESEPASGAIDTSKPLGVALRKAVFYLSEAVTRPARFPHLMDQLDYWLVDSRLDHAFKSPHGSDRV
jgi:hypothetical protein